MAYIAGGRGEGPKRDSHNRGMAARANLRLRMQSAGHRSRGAGGYLRLSAVAMAAASPALEAPGVRQRRLIVRSPPAVLGHNNDDGIDRTVDRFDPLKVCLDDFLTGNLPGSDRFGQFRSAHAPQFCGRLRPGWSFDRCLADFVDR